MTTHEIKEILQPYGLLPGGYYLIEIKAWSDLDHDSLRRVQNQYAAQDIHVQFMMTDGEEFSMRAVTPLWRNQAEIQMRLKDYTQTTVIPLPETEGTMLADADIDEYFNDLAIRISTRLDEARTALKEAQKQAK